MKGQVQTIARYSAPSGIQTNTEQIRLGAVILVGMQLNCIAKGVLGAGDAAGEISLNSLPLQTNAGDEPWVGTMAFIKTSVLASGLAESACLFIPTQLRIASDQIIYLHASCTGNNAGAEVHCVLYFIR